MLKRIVVVFGILCCLPGCQRPARSLVKETVQYSVEQASQRSSYHKEKAAELRDSGAYDLALRSLDSALFFGEQSVASPKVYRQLGWLWANKGYIRGQRQGHFIQSKSDYLKAVEYLVQAEETPILIARHVYNPLGNIYTRLGDYEHAIAFLSRSLSIAQSDSVEQLQLEAANDLAIALIENGQYNESISLLQEQLTTVKIDALSEALLLSNLARAQIEGQSFGRAASSLEKAVDLLRTILKEPSGPAQTQKARNYLLGCYNLLLPLRATHGTLEQTELLFSQAYQVSEQLYGPDPHRKKAKLYIALANAYGTLLAPEKALFAFEEALLILRSLYGNGQALYPEQLLIECLAGKVGCFQQMLESNPAWVDSIAGHYDVLFELEASVRSELLSTGSRREHVQQFHQFGTASVQFALDQWEKTNSNFWVLKALEYSEYTKGILLAESIARQVISNTQPNTLWSQLIEVEEQLADLRYEEQGAGNDLHDALHQKALLKEQLQARYPVLFDQWFARWQVDWNKVQQQAAQEQRSIVSIFDGGSAFHFFLISSQSVQAFSIPVDSVLEQAVFDWKINVANTQTEAVDFQRQGVALFQLLLAGMEPELEEAVTILPDGRLHNFSFDLLTTDIQANPQYRNMAYWLRKHTVHYAPSIQFLQRQQTPVVYNDELLVLGPSFACDSGLTELPKVELKGLESTTLTGVEATATHFLEQSGKAKITHLATHGFSSPTAERDSWIALADSTGCRHQQLHFDQIRTSGYRTDLLVLQACQSGNGVVLNGEGIFSIASGFLHAGCNSVVASNWDANPETSSHLIAHFYDQLNTKSIATSLQQAKLAYLNSEATDDLSTHPFYWAGFSIYGRNELVGSVQTKAFNWYYLLLGLLCFVLLGAFFLRK